MDMCLVVEELELKERIIEKCLLLYNSAYLQEGSDLHKIVDNYNIVRMRNDEIRREEYRRFVQNKGITEISSKGVQD